MSATIVIHTPTDKQIIPVDSGHPIISHLERGYPKKTAAELPFHGIETDLHLGSVHESTLISQQDCSRILGDGDVLHIVHRPSGFDPLTIALIVIAVIAVATVILIPTPSIPNSQGQTGKDSPNNSLSGQTNIARPYQAMPEVFGRIIAFPDLLQPSLFEYVANTKQVREVFGLGVGEFLINEIKSGQSLLSGIPGSSATVRDPGDIPPDLQIGRETNDINGQELLAPDDPTLSSIGRLVFKDKLDADSPANVQFTSTNLIDIPDSAFAYNLDLSPGDQLIVTGTVSNNATFTIASITNNAGAVRLNVTSGVTTEGPVTATFTRVTTAPMVVYSFDLNVEENLGIDSLNKFTIADTALNDGDFNVLTHGPDTFLPTIDGTPLSAIRFTVTETVIDEDDATATMVRFGQDPDANVGWFQLADTAEQVWFHFQMPRGIRDQNGNVITVNIEADIQETDSGGTPTGVIDTENYSFTGGTFDAQFQTEKFTVPVSGGFYRVRARRTTNKFAGSSLDQVKWEDAVAVTSYSGAGFGDITTVDVNTVATNFALSSSQRKINIDCTRKLPTWTAGGGFNPTLAAARKFADAVLYSLHVSAGRPLDEIDLESLYEIQDGLSDQELGRFDYSFDDKDISLGSRVQTICNAARVGVYRDGQVWRFFRDEAKTARSALFNRRNIASGDNQKQNYKLQRPKDFDSIALRYTDPVTGKRAEIKRKIDSAGETIVEGSIGARPHKIDLAGCRTVLQATDRANLEVRKILRQRRTVSDKVLSDGMLVDIGDRVGWTDIFDGDISEGEIRAINGITFDTSERLDELPAGTIFAVITDSQGAVLGPVAATVTGQKQFTATFAGSGIVADGAAIQAGSRYLLGVLDDVNASDWTVITKKPGADGRVTIELSQYDERIYEKDGVL
jgi:hypothetical protein